MGRRVMINHSVKDVKDVIRPFSLVISKETWSKFKTISVAKQITLNDYIVGLIENEIQENQEVIKLMDNLKDAKEKV